MRPVAFLLIPVVIAVVGTLVVVLLNRSPSRPDSAMEEFQREMRALAPRPHSTTPGHGSGPPDGTAGPDPADEASSDEP